MLPWNVPSHAFALKPVSMLSALLLRGGAFVVPPSTFEKENLCSRCW